MITLEKIKNASFRKSNIGGYRGEDVDQFIDQVVELCEALMEERVEAKKREEKMIAMVKEYRNRENSVGQVLLNVQAQAEETARKANAEAEEIINNAKAQAELIMNEAQNSAEEIVEKARASVQGEKDVIEGLKAEVARFKGQLLNLYKEHLTMIKALPDESARQEEKAAVVEEKEEPVQEETPVEEPAQEKSNVVLYAGIGAGVVVLILLVVLLSKKKKA